MLRFILRAFPVALVLVGGVAAADPMPPEEKVPSSGPVTSPSPDKADAPKADVPKADKDEAPKAKDPAEKTGKKHHKTKKTKRARHKKAHHHDTTPKAPAPTPAPTTK